MILLRGLTNASDASSTIDNLLKSFREPFMIDGRELILTLSVGIAIYPDNGDSRSKLLKNSDLAMYQAKNSGRNTYSYFTKAMNNDLPRRLDIEEQLCGALEKN
ncbi:MAG: GGDEF domain-containing protein [Gammaproteobacteria bacterium]|nr:GGDEF domain-containing protein [Gammaproteobacteria bacterium]